MAPSDPERDAPSGSDDAGRRDRPDAEGKAAAGRKSAAKGGAGPRRAPAALRAAAGSRAAVAQRARSPVEDTAEGTAERQKRRRLSAAAAAREAKPARAPKRSRVGAAQALNATAEPNAAPEPVGALAGPARLRLRHQRLFQSFLLVVLLPLLISAAYLWGVAKDQYASTVGFSVRREDASSAVDLLGGLTSLSKSSSSDTDILYEYLQSQKMVADMDALVDLRTIWSKPSGDPIFTFEPSGTIEDLQDYWGRMVKTSYDSSTGLIDVRVLAFDATDATRIAQTLLDQSALMINDLNTAAREDAVRYTREDLTTAEDRLRAAREAVTAFRVKNQIVDPTTDFQTQAGLVTTLENQLATALIEIDLLAGAADTDPRLVQARRRAEVIEARIAAERAKVGTQGGQKDLAALAADYERLLVDREFAEKAYVAALAAHDSAKAESQRTSRYLAAHVLPTRAEVSRFPERLSMLGLMALFLGLIWSVSALVYYSVKDRR